jgi:hypothetical protein
LIASVSYGVVPACSSTSSHTVGNPPDAGGGRGGAGGGSGGNGAAGGRGGTDGIGGSAGVSGSAGASASGGVGGTEGADASAGSAGTAGATGGTAGSAATGGTAGTGGAADGGGTAGTGGIAGRGGTTGTGGTGGGPLDAGPQNWCAKQARPAGVAAADYQCLDFENGLPPVGTWPSTVTASASRSITTARASSLPQSLITSVGGPAGTALQQASLQWHNVGSTAVSSLSITADINPVNFVGVAPPWTGTIDVLCASFGSGDACFSYTRGADLAFADGYVGYFIEFTYSGGPAYRTQCRLTGSLTSNLWSRVELRLTRNPASIQVFINGTNAIPAGMTCGASFLDDTVTDVSFGMRAYPETQAWTVYYDNVVAAVRR